MGSLCVGERMASLCASMDLRMESFVRVIMQHEPNNRPRTPPSLPCWTSGGWSLRFLVVCACNSSTACNPDTDVPNTRPNHTQCLTSTHTQKNTYIAVPLLLGICTTSCLVLIPPRTQLGRCSLARCGRTRWPIQTSCTPKQSSTGRRRSAPVIVSS